MALQIEAALVCNPDDNSNSIVVEILTASSVEGEPYAIRLYSNNVLISTLSGNTSIGTYQFDDLLNGIYDVEVEAIISDEIDRINNIVANCSIIYYNIEQSYTATCPTNYIGSNTVVIPANTYSSLISVEDANSIALQAAINQANDGLVCTLNLTFEDIDDIYTTSNGFTLSYTPELKSFTSFHSYLPHIMVSKGDRVFIGDNLSFQELNVGEEGSYFNVSYNSSISIIVNENPLVTKSIDNLFIQSTDNLSTIKVISQLKESITKNLILIEDFDYELEEDELLVKFKNNQYQLALPRATDDSRFKEKWINIQLTYDNLSPINIKYLSTLYRVVAR